MMKIKCRSGNYWESSTDIYTDDDGDYLPYMFYSLRHEDGEWIQGYLACLKLRDFTANGLLKFSKLLSATIGEYGAKERDW